ncbi:MAG: DUF4915 domain-containing protein [Mycobacteriales bacterium]
MLLVSCCNLPRPGATSLFDVGVVDGSVRPVPMTCASGDVASGVGLIRRGDEIWHVHLDSTMSAHLARFRADTLEMVGDHELPGVRDAHSLCATPDGMAVVSTGTDEVVGFAWDGRRLTPTGPLWAASEAGVDTHHLNSVGWWRGALVCSGFGPKADQTWASASEGYVVDVSTGRRLVEGLYHPHSVTELDGRLAVCDSSTGRALLLPAPGAEDVMHAADGSVLGHVDAYVRGLAVDSSGTMYLGTSMGRRRSKSTGVVLNPADEGTPLGAAGVWRLADGALTQLCSLEAVASEVYDLLWLA